MGSGDTLVENVRLGSRERVRTCDGQGVQGRGGDEGGVGVSDEVDDLDDDGEENPESEGLLDSMKDEEGEKRRSPEGPVVTLMGSEMAVFLRMFLKEFVTLVPAWSSGSDSVSVLDWARLCLHVVCKEDNTAASDIEQKDAKKFNSSRHEHRNKWHAESNKTYHYLRSEEDVA